KGRIGGDAPLTQAGKLYAQKLADFMNTLYSPASRDKGGVDGGGGTHTHTASYSSGGEESARGEELTVWTSTMLRTGQTVAPMTKDREVIKWGTLSEINAGLMDSLTYEDVAQNMPQEYEARKKDKLHYRS
ncbi:unnamed protein product, partial [Choristocarpus tenellus]